MAVRQSTSAGGRSISANTMSTMPSSNSDLLATWLYSDIAGHRPLRRLRRALTRDGGLVVTGGENGGPVLGDIERNLAAHLLSPFVTQRLRAFVIRHRAEDVATVGAMIAAGAITPAVDRTFSLDEAAAAVRYLVDGRARGKRVIDVSQRQRLAIHFAIRSACSLRAPGVVK
jgi:D-arabinose 1-dehydrogenase-like Zn-dependent alcohol dehydrogenase